MFQKIMINLIIFACLFFANGVLALENRGAFIIENFNVDILVRKDAVLEVEEIIEVEFSEKRHGIFREIPIKYKNDQGFKYNMKIEILSVEDKQGNTIQYEVVNSGVDKVLQIGDPDLEIIGNQVYVINYEIERGIRYFEEHDEIYWNPIGTGWPTEIYNASSTIRFENGMELISGSGACFTGVFGSVEKNCRVEEQSPSSVKFYANSFLEKNEGLTIVVNLPKGEILEPTKQEYFLLFLGDNWGFGLPIVVFVIMFVVWWIKGRDINLNKTIISQYEAPDNLTPGEVGFLLKERYSAKFVAADIINLAVKGYLDISEVESSEPETIKKIVRAVAIIFTVLSMISFVVGLGAVSLYIFDQNFSKIATIIICTAFSLFILLAFKRVLKKDSSAESFDYMLENKKILTEIKDLTEHEKELFRGLFGSFEIKKVKLSDKKSFYENVILASVKLIQQLDVRDYFEKSIYNKKVLYVSISVVGGFVVVILGMILQRFDFILGMLLSVPIAIVFALIMSKKTLKGAETYWKIKGYKKYIDVAEKHRSEFQARENIFEKNLPYAMIFGNIDKWAKAFEGVTKESPGWYHSNSANTFNSTVFASSIAGGFVLAAQSASASPSSSGSGGGGSSGGGGGGGGGGSW